MDKFYRDGMNIVTKSESLTDKRKEIVQQQNLLSEEIELVIEEQKSDEPVIDENDPNDGWRYGLCENIIFDCTDIPKTSWQNYLKLSFSYTFRPEDAGKAVTFCYARPYGYTDLL